MMFFLKFGSPVELDGRRERDLIPFPTEDAVEQGTAACYGPDRCVDGRVCCAFLIDDTLILVSHWLPVSHDK